MPVIAIITIIIAMLISQLISMDKVEIVVRYLHLNLYLMTFLCPPPPKVIFIVVVSCKSA